MNKLNKRGNVLSNKSIRINSMLNKLLSWIGWGACLRIISNKLNQIFRVAPRILTCSWTWRGRKNKELRRKLGLSMKEKKLSIWKSGELSKISIWMINLPYNSPLVSSDLLKLFNPFQIAPKKMKISLQNLYKIYNIFFFSNSKLTIPELKLSAF